MTVTARLHRQKDKERQKTAEKGDRRPAVAAGAGVRWRGSSTGAPGAGLRVTVAKDLRDQGSRQGNVVIDRRLLCVLLKRKKAESEAQRGKPKGTLESESRNAIVQ